MGQVLLRDAHLAPWSAIIVNAFQYHDFNAGTLSHFCDLECHATDEVESGSVLSGLRVSLRLILLPWAMSMSLLLYPDAIVLMQGSSLRGEPVVRSEYAVGHSPIPHLRNPLRADRDRLLP